MRNRYSIIGVIAAAALAGPALAGELRLLVQDDGGQPLADAVASLVPLKGRAPAVASGTKAIIDQRGLQFVPRVLAVQVGTRVLMPNSDQVRHHVYSFSPAKPFELRLYKDVPGDPGVFPTPGIVTLGCNIHDWMLGFIAVLDTPYFAKSTDDGRLQITGVPTGDYRLELWHPRRIEEAVVGETVTLGGAPLERTLTLRVSPPEPPAAAPTELEQKFRRYQAKPDAP